MSDVSSKPTQQPDAPNKLVSIPWHPALAVAFVIVTYILTQMLSAISLSVWAAINKWSAGQTEAWLDSSIYAQFFYVLIAEALAILFLYQFLRAYKRGWKTIGFRRPKWSDLRIGLAIAPLYYFSYIAIVSAAELIPSFDADQPQQLGFNPVGPLQLGLTFISLVVLPPIVEEILMRGYLYTSLRKRLSQIGAALITSVIFAGAHLQFGSDAPLLWVAAIDTFILSLFLIWLREKTGSLWASITLHALKNCIAFLSLFVFHLT